VLLDGVVLVAERSQQPSEAGTRETQDSARADFGSGSKAGYA
jgi:hypothetical protein